MGIDLPEPLRWLFKLTGSDWPDADEDKIAAFGAGVGAMYDKIHGVNDGITESVRAANLSGSGPAMTQFTGSMRQVVSDGLPNMADGSRVMGEEIRAAALQAEYSKGTAVINMAIMAPMIVQAIANAPETFGASMAIAEAGIAAVRVTVPRLLRQMVEKVVMNTAMMEGGDLAVQGYQILIKHDRAAMDGKLSLNMVEMGAVGGAMDGILTGGLQKFAPKFWKTSEAGIKDANKLIWAPPKWANMAVQAGNNTFSSLIIAGANHEPIDGKSLLQGAGLGMLFGGLTRSGGGAKLKSFDDFHMNEDFQNGNAWIRPKTAYPDDNKSGNNPFSFNVRRNPGPGDGTKNVYYGDPQVTHPEGTPPLPDRLGPVIDKVLADHPKGAPKPNVVVLEHTPPSSLDGIRALAKDKGVQIVVPHGGPVESGPHGQIRVADNSGGGAHSTLSGGSGGGFRAIHPDGTEEHLGQVYDPRRTVGDEVVGGQPPSARVSLGPGGQKYVSREVIGDGDCTVTSLADSALSQGVTKKTLHAEGLDLSHPGDVRVYRNRIADAVAAHSTDTRGGGPVLLGELGPKGAHDLLDKLGPDRPSSGSHIDGLDLATSRKNDPVAELTKRLEQNPRHVLTALEDHYNATGDKGMAQLAAYAKAKVENGGTVPQHRDLLDYAIRERTLAETPLGGEMLAAVAHTLGLDVVVVSGDKHAFHLNGDSGKQVFVHRVDSGDGGNHYRALRPETAASSKLGKRTPHPLPGDTPRPQRRVPVATRGGHAAFHRPSDGSANNALHRMAGGAVPQREPAPPPRRGGMLTTARPENPHQPDANVSALMQQAGRSHGATPPAPDGFEHVSGPDVMNVRGVPQSPDFLTGLSFDHLAPEKIATFFHRVDMARPGSDAPHLSDLFNTAGHPPPTEVPRVMHSIWLGGPLHQGDPSRAKFMDVMGANADVLRANQGRPGFTSVLWTDVPRHEIQEVRALDPGGIHTQRQNQIREMLDWADDHRIKLANVDEVFSGAEKAELHHEIATERARTTGPGYAMASDLLRVEILHRFGGVYTDGDNNVRPELAARVTEVEQDAQHHRFAISHALNGQTNNSAFISTPHNDVLQHYRENLKTRYAAPIRTIFAEKASRGNDETLRSIVGDYDPHRFFNLDVRGEVIGRTGPAGWHFNKLAQAVTGNPYEHNSWFAAIETKHIAANSDHSWLPNAQSQGQHQGQGQIHVAEHTPPADAVKAAVTTLHREAVNRGGVLHLPSVSGIIGKVAEADRDQVWHAVLHTMHETWPAGAPPHIVVSGHFQTASGRPEHLTIPGSVKDYLHDSGLFPDATFHTAAGAPVDHVEREYLIDSVRNELRGVDDARLQDLASVHKLLYGNGNMTDTVKVRKAGAVLDLLNGALGKQRGGTEAFSDALRDLTQRRFGGDGNFSEQQHLDVLVKESHDLAMRGDYSPGAHRRQTEYSRAAEGTDPTKLAAELSPAPVRKNELSRKETADRWDRAVDTLNLAREIHRESGQAVTPQQQRGLWKAVKLYRRQSGNGRSERPLTLDDLRDFRGDLGRKDPALAAGDTPHEWLRNLAGHLHDVSPDSGGIRMGTLLRHVNPAGHSRLSAPFHTLGDMVATRMRTGPSRARPDDTYAAHFPEPPSTLKWWRQDARETLRQFDELGPLVQHLPPHQYRDLIRRAGHATEFPERHRLLKQLHINVAHIQPPHVRTAVQGSRFHRHLSEELRRFGPDPEVERRDRAAFSERVEADRFRKEYIEARADGSGMWIRDPRSQHDLRSRPSATTMQPDPGHFTLTLHGSPDKVHVGQSHLSAGDVANLLRHTPEWANNPRPIRMIACNTGEHDEGFAQQLADHLGVAVKAPNTVVWGSAHGKPYATTMVYRADGTLRPIKELDGAYRVFTPRIRNADGTVRRQGTVGLDTSYEYLGRKPALTVLSRAVAGSFGDALAGRDPVVRKIINDWRQVMGQTGGSSEKAFEVSEKARDALDRVLTAETVQWMFRYAPPGSEVNQALHVLTGSRNRAAHGGRDPVPGGVDPRSRAYVQVEDAGGGHGTEPRPTPEPVRDEDVPLGPPTAAERVTAAAKSLRAEFTKYLRGLSQSEHKDAVAESAKRLADSIRDLDRNAAPGTHRGKIGQILKNADDLARVLDTVPGAKTPLRHEFQQSPAHRALVAESQRLAVTDLRVGRAPLDGSVRTRPGFESPAQREAFSRDNVVKMTDTRIWVRDPHSKEDTQLESSIRGLPPEEEGQITVSLHGGPGIVRHGEGYLTVEQLAQVVEDSDAWRAEPKPRKILLFSCYTGMSDTGFAQQLANRLGVEVKAPTDIAWVSKNGRVWVGETRYDESGRKIPVSTGTWRDFTPATVEKPTPPPARLDLGDREAGRDVALTNLAQRLPHEDTSWAPSETVEALKKAVGATDPLRDVYGDTHKPMDAARKGIDGALDRATVDTLLQHAPEGVVKDALTLLKRSREAEDAAFIDKAVKTFEDKPNHLLIHDPDHPRAQEMETTSRALVEEPGYHTVDAHGDRNGVIVGGRHLTVDQVARIIESDPRWQRSRSPIRLASCDAGRDAEGFAQQLARRLGVEVKAPTDTVWVSHRGDAFVTGHRYGSDGTVRPERAVTGGWRVFSPHEGTAPRTDTADLHGGDGIDEAALDTLRSFSEDDLARLERIAATMTPEEIQRIGRQAVLAGVDHPDAELLSRVPVGLSPEKAARVARVARVAWAAHGAAQDTDVVPRGILDQKADSEFAKQVGERLEALGWKKRGGSRSDIYYLPKGTDFQGKGALGGSIAASQVHSARSYAEERDRQALRWLATTAMDRLQRDGLDPQEVQAGLSGDGHLYISANVDRAAERLRSLINGGAER
ncbi:MAG: DUF4347 domain-containing protein, partial [Catenulispora sp.]|nr:DUF4347 domain-containing protein [Catenulispora sp.]